MPKKQNAFLSGIVLTRLNERPVLGNTSPLEDGDDDEEEEGDEGFPANVLPPSDSSGPPIVQGSGNLKSAKDFHSEKHEGGRPMSATDFHTSGHEGYRPVPPKSEERRKGKGPYVVSTEGD